MTARILSEERQLLVWRRRLKDADSSNLIDNLAVDELVTEAKTLVGYYFRSSPIKSDVFVRRELLQLAKGLTRAARALEAVGIAGLLRVHAAAGLKGDETELERFVQVGKMLLFERWARATANINLQDVSSKSKPGPASDTILNSVVWLLADLYQRRLGLKPTHTVSPSTGKSNSLFNEFLRAAVSDFKPSGVRISWRKLDTATLRAIKELRSPP